MRRLVRFLKTKSKEASQNSSYGNCSSPAWPQSPVASTQQLLKRQSQWFTCETKLFLHSHTSRPQIRSKGHFWESTGIQRAALLTLSAPPTTKRSGKSSVATEPPPATSTFLQIEVLCIKGKMASAPRLFQKEYSVHTIFFHCSWRKLPHQCQTEFCFSFSLMSPESSDTPFKKKAFVLHYYFSHSSKDGEETTAVEQNAQSIRRKQPSTLYFTQKD